MNNINDLQKELASNKNKLKLLYQKQIQEHKMLLIILFGKLKLKILTWTA